MRTIQLHEYERASGITPEVARVLQDRFHCRIALTDTSGHRYNVEARQYVGAVVDGDTTVIVRPKLPIERVLFLLAHSVDPTWAGDAALAEADSLTEGVVTLFAAACDRAMRNGILRGYRDHRERLHTVRGRIDFAEQLRTNPGRALPLAVSYQEHDQDIVENQLLLAALSTVADLPIHSTTTHRAITRLRRTLADVTPRRFDACALPSMTWTRLNQHYRPAVELARVILAGADTDLHTGSVRVPGLVFDMNTVFEHFVRTALRHELRLGEEEFPDGRNAQLPFDEARRLRIKPDLSIRHGGDCRMVGEIKYRHDTGDGRATHLYQTLAYASAAGLSDATLIYADGPPEPRTHVLPNASVHIHVRHLDLNLPRPDLLRQVRSLAEHINAPTGTG
jgi:5-methylcytosine-specific restriction enzyme subunit McrC